MFICLLLIEWWLKTLLVWTQDRKRNTIMFQVNIDLPKIKFVGPTNRKTLSLFILFYFFYFFFSSLLLSFFPSHFHFSVCACDFFSFPDPKLRWGHIVQIEKVTLSNQFTNSIFSPFEVVLFCSNFTFWFLLLFSYNMDYIERHFLKIIWSFKTKLILILMSDLYYYYHQFIFSN